MSTQFTHPPPLLPASSADDEGTAYVEDPAASSDDGDESDHAGRFTDDMGGQTDDLGGPCDASARHATAAGYYSETRERDLTPRLPPAFRHACATGLSGLGMRSHRAMTTGRRAHVVSNGMNLNVRALAIPSPEHWSRHIQISCGSRLLALALPQAPLLGSRGDEHQGGDGAGEARGALPAAHRRAPPERAAHRERRLLAEKRTTRRQLRERQRGSPKHGGVRGPSEGGSASGFSLPPLLASSTEQEVPPAGRCTSYCVADSIELESMYAPLRQQGHKLAIHRDGLNAVLHCNFTSSFAGQEAHAF